MANIPDEIFKSPIRRPNNKNGSHNKAPLSEYVDYTPRRMAPSSLGRDNYNDRSMTLESTSASAYNNITFAKQRRSYFYQQLAKQTDDGFDERNYLDSPVVRRQFGINDHVVEIESPPPESTITTTYSQKLKAAQDVEYILKQYSKRKWSIEDFEVGNGLGTGKFGIVFKAREKRTDQVVALKILKKVDVEVANVVPFLRREIEIQSHLDHPNIIKLFGYFHDEKYIYLVLEYAGEGDLYSGLERHKRFTEIETVSFILDIAAGLEYLHDIGVMHRDIKLENILLSKDKTLKIADFGWAVYDPKPTRRYTFCGTLDYLPPEMVHNKSHDHSADVWALGVLCYELLVGRPPFERKRDAEDHEETYSRITRAEITFPNDISVGAQKFILKLLQREPSERIRISDIHSDPWIEQYSKEMCY